MNLCTFSDPVNKFYGLMKKVMMNMKKMLMMNVMEMRMLKLMDMHHPFELLIKFLRMSKGYMFLRKHHLVMYQTT